MPKMEYATKNKTLYEAFFKYRNVFTDIFMMVLGTVVLAVMSNISIPLWPVPITMQTFGLFLIAFFFGSRKGALTIALYIITGLLGFGVFAGYKSGIGAILGPTGGYILGFLLCVFVIGYMIEKGYGRTKTSILWTLVFGNIAIYSFGLLGLWRFLGNIGAMKILTMGLFPFLIGDAVKILGAMALFPYLWKGSERISA
jgi:biotin transport system substrate-specific component